MCSEIARERILEILDEFDTPIMENTITGKMADVCTLSETRKCLRMLVEAGILSMNNDVYARI